MRLVELIFPYLVVTGVAAAQATAEHATITSASGTASTAAKGAGKSIGGIFDGLNRTLARQGDGEKKTTGAAKRDRKGAATTTAQRKPAEVVQTFEPIEPAAIKPGMAIAEIVKRFGAPSLKTGRKDGAAYLETLWYSRAGRPDVTIRVKDGVVEAVTAN